MQNLSVHAKATRQHLHRKAVKNYCILSPSVRPKCVGMYFNCAYWLLTLFRILLFLVVLFFRRSILSVRICLTFVRNKNADNDDDDDVRDYRTERFEHSAVIVIIAFLAVVLTQLSRQQMIRDSFDG